MVKTTTDLRKLLQTQLDNEGVTSTMDISSAYVPRQYEYLNELYLFTVYFSAIPNYVYQRYMNCKKANLFFSEKYSNEINDFYFKKKYSRSSQKSEFDEIFYFLYEDLLVNFTFSDSEVKFLFKKTDNAKVEEIMKTLKRFMVKEARRSKIFLLMNSNDVLELKSFKIKKPKLSIEDNYNDDFKEIHQIIHKRLSGSNEKGLVLLHGKPGTGKTSYIRHLISSLKKKVIFLPPDLASIITSPDLVHILVYNPNSILVIEDAENIIMERDQNGKSPVSALLNITDGLLSDHLNIQIICSFNTDISKIDNALMRKGRLIAKYEFRELEVEKARRLSGKLGFITSINSPMLLTSIYNQEERNFNGDINRNTIGFKSTNTVQ